MNQREFLYLCARGNYDQIEEAIAGGASVNRKAKYHGISVHPLFVATMELNFQAIEALLSHRAKNFPAFMAAMILEDEAMLHFLVNDCGADINCSDNHHRTPLLCAVMANKAKLVKMLVRFGADVNLRAGAGYSALTYAVFMYDETNENSEKPDPEIIKILMKAGADCTDAMLNAVRTNNLRLVRLLVRNGADVNAKYPLNHSLLSVALLNLQVYGDKALPMIEFFIKHGADVNGLPVLDGERKSGDDDGNDFVLTNNISLAVSMESPKGLELLQRNGADPNIRDSRGRSPLMYSVLTGHDVLKTLLKYGADPNLGDFENRTPLTLAVIDNGSDDGIMETLLENGADPNIRDNSGFTPLTWAVNDRDRAPEVFVSALIRTGAIRAEGSSEWFAIAVLSSILRRELQLENVKILVKFGADVNIPDKKGITALSWAIMNVDDEITEILKQAKIRNENQAEIEIN